MLFAFSGPNRDVGEARRSLGLDTSEQGQGGSMALGQGAMDIGAFLQALMRFAMQYGQQRQGYRGQGQEWQGIERPGAFQSPYGEPSQGASQPGVVRQPEAVRQGGIVSPWQGIDPWTTVLPTEGGEGKPLGIL